MATDKLELPREKWTGRVREIKLGDGGRRPVALGGVSTLPFLKEEGSFPNPPRIAIELRDDGGLSFPETLRSAWGEALGNLGTWARQAAELGPDLLVLRLKSTHPDYGDRGKEWAKAAVDEVLSAVNLPLIVIGPDVPEKDNEVLTAVSEVARGQRIGLGNCIAENYRTIAACCLSDGHVAVAKAPPNAGLIKQLNSFLLDLQLPPDSIITDPTAGALGYGLECAFSAVEMLRLSALGGDSLAASPIIVFPSIVWRYREARLSEPAWGRLEERAPRWEALTAFALLQAGADALVMCHPKAVELIKQAIKELERDGAHGTRNL